MGVQCMDTDNWERYEFKLKNGAVVEWLREKIED